MPAVRGSLGIDNSIECEENVTKDSVFDDSSLSSRETSPSLRNLSEIELNNANVNIIRRG